MIEGAKEYFEIEQVNEALKELDVKSGSAFNNCIQFTFTIVFLMVIHIPILNFSMFNPDKNQGKCKYYPKLV